VGGFFTEKSSLVYICFVVSHDDINDQFEAAMGFKLQAIKNDNWEVVLFDEPSYIHGLKMAPGVMEPQLGSGIWLVVTFPVWSGSARYSIHAAIACTKQYAGRFNLGIRPFDSHDEINKWWPTTELPAESKIFVTEVNDGQRREVHITTDNSTNPVWLILKNNRVVYQGSGVRSVEQLEEIMQSVLHS
jgi:hypothetical protein